MNTALSYMTEEQRSLIKLEDRYREMFATEPNNKELKDKFLLLHKVFDHYDEYVRVPETEEEKKQPHLLENAVSSKIEYGKNTIVRRDEFFKNWEEFTLGMFDGLDWTNIFCAGGCIVGNLASVNYDKRGKDIDLFIHGVNSDEEANRVLKRIYDCIMKNTREKGKGVQIIRTMNAVTIINSYPFRPVQIILRLYKTPAEVLLGFDIDSCAVGYDGITNELYASERFKRAMVKGYNLVNQTRRSTTYEQRLYKYSLRGFSIIVPGLRFDKIRSDLFNNKEKLKSLTGLKKLLYYDYLVKNRRHRVDSYAEIKESDYSGDLDIPFGPSYDHEKIMKILNNRDKQRFFGIIMKNKKSRERGEQPTIKPSRLIENLLFDDYGNPVQKINWVKDAPAYQDYDNGHRRLMVGSFKLPPLDEKWDQGVYIDDDGYDGPVDSKTLSNQKSKSSFSVGVSSSFTNKNDLKSTTTTSSSTKTSSLSSTTSSFSGGVSFQPAKYSPPKKPSRKENDKKSLPKRSFGGVLPTTTSSSSISSNLVPSSSIFASTFTSKSTTETSTGPTSQFGSIFPTTSTTQTSPFSVPEVKTTPFTTTSDTTTSTTQTSPFSVSDVKTTPFTTTVDTTTSTTQTSPFSVPEVKTTPFTTSSFKFSPSTTPKSLFGGSEVKSTSSTSLTPSTTEKPSSSSSLSSDITSTPISSKYGPQPGKIPPSYYYYGTPPQSQSYYYDENEQKSVQPPDYFQLSTTVSSSSKGVVDSSLHQQKQVNDDNNKLSQQPSDINIYQQQIHQQQKHHHHHHHIQSDVKEEHDNEVYSSKHKSPTTKLLLLVDLCFKSGKITKEQKGRIKDLIIMDHPKILNALDVFIIQHDIDDFIDTALRIDNRFRNEESKQSSFK